jgi:putative intracellular protease/amidase
VILTLLPTHDFDPTETALPWALLTEAGHEVRFATPDGAPGRVDERLVSVGFGPLTPLFMTRPDALAHFRRMEASPAFRTPSRYDDVDIANVDLLLVPGGHAQGMKTMIESTAAQRLVVAQFKRRGAVGAVCHGVLLLARSLDPVTGRSVLYGRRTTALPAKMEVPAWIITKPVLGDYYRTYPESVQFEVVAALRSKSDFDAGPLLPIRDSPERPERGFVVRDGNYVSARWPGDCNAYARALVALADEARAKTGASAPEGAARAGATDVRAETRADTPRSFRPGA